MMSTISSGAAGVAAQQAQTQIQLQQTFVKQNAEQPQAIADLIEQGANSAEAAASAPPPGTGTQIDVSV